MGDLEIEKPMTDEKMQQNGLPNGLANGTSEHKENREHKSKDRDKDRDREKSKDKHHDKDRHKSSHKDRDRDKERSKDKDRHSSSHKSSHKDKDKDKDKDRDRDKHRDKDKDKDRHKDKDKQRDKEKNDKDRSRDDKHKDRSDKEKRDKDKEKERSSDKHKDRDKDRSKDKERDRHREDKDRKSSSNNSSSNSSSKRDKDRHHSSHKSSHKDKHRDRSKHHSEKVKEIKEEKREIPDIPIKVEQDDFVNIKEEPVNTAECSFQSMDDFQVSRDSHAVKEDSEDDSKLVIKEEVPEENEEEDDDVPLAARKRPKPDYNEENDEDDEKPLISRKKIKSEKKKRKAMDDDYEEEDEDFAPAKKKVKKKTPKKPKVEPKSESYPTPSPTKGKKKKVEEEQNVWKWWEEEKRDDGKKWTFLEHKGPVFADPYEPLPNNIKFYYDGNHMVLSQPTEEVAGFYSKMLDHDYTTKEIFNKNFFKDWRKAMTEKEKVKIIDLKKCDFRNLHAYYVQKNEERKNRTKEEKKILKEKNEAMIKEYGWCSIDGHKQRIGNFKIEPPGLFRGRGEHPKQGMVKKRSMPEEVIINCSKDSQIPKPPDGRKWKEVRHDPAVTWLACWNENIQGSTKYVMLNAASKLKGEKDWQKYETARRLHKHVDKIRDNYRADWKSKEMRIRQRGVALYFIDKLALRAGNEKDEDQADTVGCCSLRYEHLKLYEKKDGKEFMVVFDFLGKDSIRYYNEVPVEKRVFKNLQLFMENKQDGDDIFDRLNTQILNKYLNDMLEGLTAKVFRTYNASRTLQEQLEKVTNPEDPLAAQILSYNRANREVAILCNHQRAVPKTFDKSMANLSKKIEDKREVVRDVEKELKSLKKAAKHGGSVKDKVNYEKKKKAAERLREQLDKLEISATDKEENKQIALGTSKLNYLDPRITVAWCKKFDIPIEKVYNKTQRQKFQWAIDMATSEYNFLSHNENEKFKGKEEDDGEEEEEE